MLTWQMIGGMAGVASVTIGLVGFIVKRMDKQQQDRFELFEKHQNERYDALKELITTQIEYIQTATKADSEQIRNMRQALQEFREYAQQHFVVYADLKRHKEHVHGRIDTLKERVDKQEGRDGR